MNTKTSSKNNTIVVPNFQPPRVGMLAIVRKRRGVVTEVREFPGEMGLLHLTRIDYKDDYRPISEELIWELEPSTRLLEPNELPRPSDEPMRGDEFDALIRAARWSAINPYLDPDAEGPLDRLPVSSPFHGAIEVENYQLVPLLKALRMPRVSLLIADDVGLGKTIEAGLILSELLIRRRVNRILILTPASLRIQWQRDELWGKFALPFEIVDRETTFQLKKSFGIDSNPWRCCSRIVSSYHYLRQPDVLEQFLSASRVAEGSPNLPWDLLIVDEVHNLMPAPMGEDSQLCQMLRHIIPLFEHRIFLTATPHNGHTRSFSGLLEMLDPVRFSRTDELRPAERERVKQVVIRRLKREINERTDPPRFCTRKPPLAILLDFAAPELQLINAYEMFRSKVRTAIAQASKKRRLAGKFAIEILGKRLLSGPITFFESWRRCKLGLKEEETADDDALVAAGKTVEEDMPDDREAQERGKTASSIIGAWMKPIYEEIQKEIRQIDGAAKGLGIDLGNETIFQNPKEDSRFHALCDHIEKYLRKDGKWREDERMVVFTEYKTTLDYLLRRLRDTYAGQDERFMFLYGGMDDLQREQIKDAFNDAESKVRVLIATDAASEGLNLQSTARYLLHYDCPWNPSRLEQRNGRLDRHGQARDVTIFHFASEENADLKFMSYLIGKVDQIREDLGTVGEIFDEATHRRLIEGDDVKEVQETLDGLLDQVRETIDMDADDSIEIDPQSGEEILQRKIEALASELDLDPVTQRDTLETAMAIEYGHPQLSDPDSLDRFTFINPNLAGWKDTIDETIRKQTRDRTLGPVPKLAFSAKPFIQMISGRPVFRPRADTLMLHQGHPLMQKAVGVLTRKRYPETGAVSRWTVRYGDVPDKYEALILLHVEELGVNELRETFHHWIQTYQLPVSDGELGASLPHTPAAQLGRVGHYRDAAQIEQARHLLDDLEPDLQDFVRSLRSDVTKRLREQLILDGDAARKEEERRYQSRQGEVSALIADNTLAKLEKEIRQLKINQWQGRLFESQSYIEDLEQSIKIMEEELQRRKQHYEEIRDQLARERERIVKYLMPKRYTLQGEAQVFPVAVEVRFPFKTGGDR